MWGGMRLAHPIPYPVALLAAISAAATGVQAQEGGRPATTIRVQVTDSTGTPLRAAEVTILAGVRVVVRGMTDAAGRQALSMRRDSGDFQLVVRKLGFQPFDQFFRA